MSDMKTTPKPYAHHTGRQLGIYHVEEMLGRGGMAEVYKSRHPELDRDVAIKILHPHRTDDPNFIERFRREAKMAATLRHPHIVQVYDFAATEDGLYYMILEFVKGQSLTVYLEQNAPLPLQKVYAICEQIMSAVQYAHERGIIHRDIKPDNIMIDPSDTVYLMDFGIAQMTAVPGLTQSHMTIGTPLYMAPEQMRSQPITTAVDIYSLGMLIYYMVTNRYPYDSDTPASLMTLKLTEPPVPPRNYTPDIPSSLETIILTALAIEPDKRYATVGQMRRALEKSLSDKKQMPESTKVMWNLLGVENYKITEAIPAASGSASRRFLAHNTILNQPAVIEVLNTTSDKDPELTYEFNRRISALSQIQHPGVAVVTSTGVSSHNEPYVCVEYSGVPLTQKAAEWRETEGGSSPVFALQLAQRIAGALAAGQEAGICHNDLRADNVLYQPDGSVIVAGFEVPLPILGVPAADGDSPARLPYYAPEQLAGNELTPVSNIYSLGVILYELLAGQRPFLLPPSSSGKGATARTHTPLVQARPGLAAETYTFVGACLQTDAAARPATMAEVTRRLNKAISAESKPLPIIVQPDRRSYAPLFWGVGALLLLAALMFLPSWTNGSDLVGKEEPTAVPGDSATGPSATGLPAIVPTIEPSAIPTRWPTITAVPTQLSPTSGSTTTPTRTPTPTPTMTTPTGTTAVCNQTPPANWVRYRIQANDSLSKIAAAGGIPVEYLQQVNCLTGITLSIGQEIWAPVGATTATSTVVGQPTVTATNFATLPGSTPNIPMPTVITPTSTPVTPTLTPPSISPTFTPPPG